MLFVAKHNMVIGVPRVSCGSHALFEAAAIEAEKVLAELPQAGEPRLFAIRREIKARELLLTRLACRLTDRHGAIAEWPSRAALFFGTTRRCSYLMISVR